MIGQTLSHFKITDKLGEGGMGEVYRAEDTKLGRQVAIKVLPEAVAEDPERLARFEREARVLASLNHPHIAAIYSIESATPSGRRGARLTSLEYGDATFGEPHDENKASDPSLGKPPTGQAADVEVAQGDRRAQPQPTPAERADQPPRPIHFLVMELVEGEDLKKRLERGKLSTEEALPIAFQMAEAIEAAHEQGIVHRDLKPANVVVDREGEVKVLDFGLAKALDSESDSMIASGLSMSPTLTAQMTDAGVILGTAAYMSPEQARGKRVDRRSDIWSFGCVLFEMLSGVTAYGGETVTDILGAIVHKEPEWDALPGVTPQPVRKLLARCLEKDPRRRLQAMGEGRLVIERYLEDPEAFEISSTQPDAAAYAPASAWKRALPWMVAAAALLVASGLGIFSLRLFERFTQSQRLLRTVVLPPEGHDWDLDGIRPGRVAISPDGRQLAFSAEPEDGGESILWIRPLDSPVGRPLPNTEDAAYPFWSPDGKYVAFFAGGKLKKITVAGGPPVSLCDAPNGKGGSWNGQGTIIFTPTQSSGLLRVPAAGGDCVPLTELDAEAEEDSHRHPWFLPDGRHFLYLVRPRGNASQNVLRVGSLDSDLRANLLETPTNAAYASDRLLFIREGTLMAQDFDPDRLELSGEAVPVVEQVLQITGAALSIFAVSESGELVYQTGSSNQKSQLFWKDRSGEDLGSLGDPADQIGAVLSPDGDWVAAQLIDESGQQDIWLYDVKRNLRNRFTFNQGQSPVWAPDGSRIAFVSDREGAAGLYLKEVGGTGEAELLYANDNRKFPVDWTPDGKMVLYIEFTAGATRSLFGLPVEGGREPIPLIESEFALGGPVVSPDGRWLAYTSTESGRNEVYVTTFPQLERKWQVSSEGGRQPVWTKDGREIVFVSLPVNELYAAEVSTEDDTFSVGSVQKVLDLDLRADPGRDWDVTADGERILTNAMPDRGRVSALHFVVNWPAILEEE